MPRLMQYSGTAVPIFAWTPDDQPVPVLASTVEGEHVGDQAFVDGRAMHWDGDKWVVSLWKDFAVWRKEATDASPFEQRELTFDMSELEDEIDLVVLEGDARELVVEQRELRGANAS
jgi:hypothetical protein